MNHCELKEFAERADLAKGEERRLLMEKLIRKRNWMDKTIKQT